MQAWREPLAAHFLLDIAPGDLNSNPAASERTGDDL